MAADEAAPGPQGTGAQETLSNLLHEGRRFAPPAALAEAANVRADAYRASRADRLGFWAEQARRLHWDREWDQVLDWSGAPFARWFVGGRLNVAYNCVDRHVEAGHGDQIALYFEGEPGDRRAVSYAELQREVCRAANALTSLGVRAGDRVAIYLPMLPETVVAMLACARIGAPHSVVFAAFSPGALRSRIDDAQAKVLITADGYHRRGSVVALKPNADAAVEADGGAQSIEHVLVVRRSGTEVPWTEGRDLWWHELTERQSEAHTPEFFDSEHPLFILYTSGTTGRPKGILHTTGGYLTQVSYTHRAVFDLKPDTDVFWCTADVGWVTGHSYIVYGPLANRTTEVLYEGTPDTPNQGRFWENVDRYGVTILYTAPTAIRTFMKWGTEIPARYSLSSLRLLGSVGEPINPEAWIWYRENIGHARCPIVDTWWQTETGGIMISPLPGVTETKPGSAMTPLPGISADVVDVDGKPVPNGSGGLLVLDQPWPSMLRGIWGDEERYRTTYWARFAEQGYYFAGDGAKKDEDGDIWLLGRVDDIMLVSGHNISTTEVESALVSHPAVAEAAVVGAADETTGQRIVAFVILRGGNEEVPDLAEILKAHVSREIGPIAKPRQIQVVQELPKTRSGKIMRRLLKDVAEDRALGDTTTLTDASVMELIASKLPHAAD
ncbi:acetate--CoA ligase [Streptacidiphilus jiangxiensis]|uniref:Acetyl-coenzyme A synthetase n=1 Tax=Streptacidiphilus jiangxiensis TaxID=235985 RepID=A0A1H7HNB7_STRJI|nr:acetate--CoA ligase [Streptacidiphilus jiangxiensis]SEK51749.1 acetyl-CoA synthetase [Streptacidiphilus jiangxiensis]